MRPGSSSTAKAKPKTIRYTRPWLYPKQETAIFNPVDCTGAPARFSFVEAGTKTGKTVGCIAWLFEQALFGKRNNNYWWIAPVFAQAKIAFTRMKNAFPPGTFTVNESDLKLTLALVGTVVWFKSAEKPDNLYGEDVFAAVFDEASRGREESWYALRSTLTATRGPVRFIGNVKGRKNWFYALARKAEAGEPGSAQYKIVASDAVTAGVLAAEEIESARRDLPEQVFRELYLAEPSDDGGNPFGLAAIARCVAPLSERKPVVWGWDLAKHVDWTVGIGLDDAGYVCRFERFQKPWDATMARIISCTGRLPALIDSTGVGDPIVELLQKTPSAHFEGYSFSSNSKQKLMEGLAVAIQGSEVHFPDGPIRNELSDFEYEYTRTGVRYCVDPATPVLTDDLRWVDAASLSPGDGLLAFDENPVDRKVRRWRRARVTATEIIERPCYRLTMEDGTVIVCSAEHRWLVASNNGPALWKLTSELRGRHEWSHSLRFTPHRLIKPVDVWQEATTYQAGYLSAAFDGEGTLSQHRRNDRREGFHFRLSIAQRENAMAAEIRKTLAAFNFSWAESAGNGTNKDVSAFGVTGRARETLRLLGQIRPKRLLAKFDPDKIGAMWSDENCAIKSIEFLGDRPVVAMGTTSKTFLAAGYASHNSAPEGFHDDCVCSLALAVMQKSHARRPLLISDELLRRSAMVGRR